jgi:hypothetical protein
VISQRKRKRVEEVFGWMKTVATLRKTRHRGTRIQVHPVNAASHEFGAIVPIGVV